MSTISITCATCGKPPERRIPNLHKQGVDPRDYNVTVRCHGAEERILIPHRSVVAIKALGLARLDVEAFSTEARADL